MLRRSHRHLRARLLSSALIAAVVVAGCASSRGRSQTAEKVAQVAQPTATPSPAASQGPIESIEINYARADDYLESLSVTKYSGVSVILTRDKNGKTYSVVRFQGDQPVWAIRNESGPGTSIFHLPGGGKTRPDALKSVSYGRTPSNFVQETPDYGSPEPLEAGRYYVFSVVRGSGALSFQAVKVRSDSSIEVYDAEPRAGSSYELCCDLAADFVSAPESQPEESSSP